MRHNDLRANRGAGESRIITKICRGDVVLILCVAVIACAAAFASLSHTAADMAEIKADGRLWRRIPLSLSTSVVFEKDGRRNVISVRDGAVRMEDANCPDRYCVKHGAIKTAGSVIVCVPNRVTIHLIKSDESAGGAGDGSGGAGDGSGGAGDGSGGAGNNEIEIDTIT